MSAQNQSLGLTADQPWGANGEVGGLFSPEITRSIQMLGLKRNRQVDGAKITAAINNLLA
jgi:hypothetical protein